MGQQTNLLTAGHFENAHHPHLPISTPSTPWPLALAVAAVLSSTTAVVEETAFRLQFPFVLSCIVPSATSIPVALIGQAALFGALHWSPKASFGENKLVTSFQATSGLWYGLVYLFSGGDILPCIVSHAFYDFQVFFSTWMTTNDQIDYADNAYLAHVDNPSPEIKNEDKEVKRIIAEAKSKVPLEVVHGALLRMFYTFDYDHAGGLSNSDVRRSVSWLSLQDPYNPPESLVDDLVNSCLRQRAEKGISVPKGMGNRLRFPDFLKVFLSLRQKALEQQNEDRNSSHNAITEPGLSMS
jgi:hypothetical protein